MSVKDFPKSHEQIEAEFQDMSDKFIELLDEINEDKTIPGEYLKWLRKNVEIAEMGGTVFKWLYTGQMSMGEEEATVATFSIIWGAGYKQGRHNTMIGAVALVTILFLFGLVPILAKLGYLW